jgi:hypothetical protein
MGVRSLPLAVCAEIEKLIPGHRRPGGGRWKQPVRTQHLECRAWRTIAALAARKAAFETPFRHVMNAEARAVAAATRPVIAEAPKQTIRRGGSRPRKLK